MKYSARIAVALLAATSFTPVFAQTWCGKNYMSNQTVVPPGGEFQLPPTSAEPLVAFRCSPAFRPYLEQDAKHASIVVDTPIIYRYVQDASPISLSSASSKSSQSNLGSLDVTISIGNQVFAIEEVSLNGTGHEISLDLSSLKAQKTAYNVSCEATYQAGSSSSSAQKFSTSTSLLYLPDTNTSVVKTDLRTGSLWARPANGTGGPFKPFVPQGFYIEFDPYLEANLSLINQLKIDGFNTIHPIPPYNNTAVFDQVLSLSAELGLYLVFDMRSVYQNLTAVAQQVQQYQSLPNLLLWETAHEPDGNSDPLDAAANAYDLIYELDGYHPVSIVLNCQDYNFSPYVEGADIVLEDAYPIGINATYSPVWHTPCTTDFGHCGCDNCQGSVYDIRSRIETFKERLDVLGYDRSKTVWSTPQAFGNGSYWDTIPTGKEWSGIHLTSFIHGATGAISYQFPTTSGNVTTIGGTTQILTSTITNTIQSFIVDAKATHASYLANNAVDIGVWQNGTAYLVLLVNFNETATFVTWAEAGLEGVTSNATVHRAYTVDQRTNTTGFQLQPGSIGIYTATPSS